MYADVKGALAQIDRSWRAFEHDGKRMSKKEVKAVLEFAVGKGYKSTGDIPKSEIDNIIENLLFDNNAKK